MLEQVRIQNFKSLKDVTLDLQKVNLLIGPNNSGKSNFLKALEILKDLLFDEYDDSNTLKNNFGVRFKHNSEPVKFSLFIFDRFLEIKTENIESSLIEDLKLKLLSIVNESDLEQEKYFVGFIRKCKLFFNSVVVFRPNPMELSKSFPILPNQERINSDASNLVAFFDNIRDKHLDSFESIEKGLNLCIPEFDRIVFDNVIPTEEQKKQYGDKTFKRFGLYSQEQKQTYWADELSEGVLYLLALLCIVHQPNPPKLLLLEEPEKGIHPRRIREVMNFIFQLAEQKDIQVIITSHSEHVLEDFATIPESVFVFDKDDEGATFVKNLKKDIIEPSHKKSEELGVKPIDFTSNIGENWFMGLMGGVPV